MTTHLSQAEIATIIEQLSHVHAAGRSEHAPELALITEKVGVGVGDRRDSPIERIGDRSDWEHHDEAVR